MFMCTTVYMSMERLMLLFLTQASLVQGAFFQPIAYIFPEGLQSVNGSSNIGGCQPESCVMMPISGTVINGCDCLGNIPASGILIDGVVPNIDTTQNGTWASELFTVNRVGQDSFMIGFQFSHIPLLRYVEIVYLDCSIWGIGLTAVNVYSSFSFPTFSSAASTNIGMLSLAENTDQGCTSLRTISIPLQPTLSAESYFVEFIFRGSSVHPINWLHLAETSFSDVAPTTMMLTTLTVSSESATLPTTITLEATTTMSESGEDDSIMTTTTKSTTDKSTHRLSDSNIIDATLPTVINTPTTISVPVFVVTLVVVIAVLILLTVIIAMLCITRGRTQKQDAADGDTEYDDVIEKATELSGVTSPIEMNANKAYGTHQPQDNNTTRILETSMEAHYEELC